MLRWGVCALLVLGATGAGFRCVAPDPSDVFAAAKGVPDAPSSSAERLYRLLHTLANLDLFPVYSDLWVAAPTHAPPGIGTPGFSESEQGRNLSDLRARHYGGASRPTGTTGLAGAIEHEMRHPGRRPAPPPLTAYPKRLAPGE